MLHLHTTCAIPTSTPIPHSLPPAAAPQAHPPVQYPPTITPIPAAAAADTAAASKNHPYESVRWQRTLPPQTTHKSTGAGTTPVAARDTTRRNQSLIPIPRRPRCCGSARCTAAAVAPSLPYASSPLLPHTFLSLSLTTTLSPPSQGLPTLPAPPLQPNTCACPPSDLVDHLQPTPDRRVSCQ